VTDFARSVALRAGAQTVESLIAVATAQPAAEHGDLPAMLPGEPIILAEKFLAYPTEPVGPEGSQTLP
jgi:hypothetical protein